MRIQIGSPHDPDVALLLDEHLAEMRATSPPGSVHALPHAALAHSDVRLLAAREVRTGGAVLLGVGALKRHDERLGEVKAMRTAPSARGRGVAAALLAHLLDLARTDGLAAVALETGSQDHFAPARRLYARHRFVECGPFADYRPDPHSVFMRLALP